MGCQEFESRSVLGQPHARQTRYHCATALAPRNIYLLSIFTLLSVGAFPFHMCELMYLLMASQIKHTFCFEPP